MNDAQTWTVIGGLMGVVTLMSSLLLRVVRVEVGSMRAEMSTQFAAIRTQIAGLDRDVHMLVAREIDRDQ